MLVYCFAIAQSLLFAALYSVCQKNLTLKLSDRYLIIKQKNLFLLYSFIPLFLTSVLRYDVGVDYKNYLWIFEAITKFKQSTHVEFGYKLINSAVGFFTDDFNAVLVITTAITLVFFFKGICDNSESLTLSLFLFLTLGYYFYSLISIRHFMALSIFFFAQKYIKSREFLKFLLFTLIAASFHKIALLGLLLYFVLDKRYKTVHYLFVFAVLVLCIFVNKQIMDIIFTFVYQSYKGSVYNVYDFSIFNVILCLLCSFFSLFYYKPLLKKDSKNIVYINSSLFSLMFYLTCWWIPTPTRIGHFLTIFSIIIIPKAISCEKNKKIKAFYYVFLITFCALFFIVMMQGSYSESIKLLPYKTIFER